MELYLVNYRQKDSEPFKSITDLPLEKAKELAKRLYKSSSCKAHRRFGSEFVQYYENRQKAEQWLYDNFLKLGGKPEGKHPLYFTLQSSEDSMALYYCGTLHHVFTKNDLLEQLELYDNDVNKILERNKEQAVFIEAQLWNDKYLKERE